MAVRAAAQRVRPCAEHAAVRAAPPADLPSAEAVPPGSPPPARAGRRAIAAHPRAPDRRQPRQPPGRPGDPGGVRPSASQPRAGAVREGLLLRPGRAGFDRLPPGERDPHGHGPLRRPRDPLLPGGAAPGRQRGSLSRGQPLRGRADSAVQAGGRAVGAEAPAARPARLRAGHIRMLEPPHGPAPSRPRRGGLRAAGPLSRQGREQGQLAEDRPGPPTPCGTTGAGHSEGVQR